MSIVPFYSWRFFSNTIRTTFWQRLLTVMVRIIRIDKYIISVNIKNFSKFVFAYTLTTTRCNNNPFVMFYDFLGSGILSTIVFNLSKLLLPSENDDYWCHINCLDCFWFNIVIWIDKMIINQNILTCSCSIIVAIFIFVICNKPLRWRLEMGVD